MFGVDTASGGCGASVSCCTVAQLLPSLEFSEPMFSELSEAESELALLALPCESLVALPGALTVLD
jgi:hypothetical protein